MNAYEVDRKKWLKMSIFDQMGNISSEVGRSFNARRHHSETDCLQATNRAIDMFDATVDSLLTSKSPKTKEVLRAKESYLAAIFGPEDQAENIESLEKYFMQFAIAARLNR